MEMSLTRVLAEIKMLDKRIEKHTTNDSFMAMVIDGRTSNNEDTQEVSKRLVANLDRVKGLINRRDYLKARLIETNALTRVEIAGEEMSIAQAIDKKASIINTKRLLQGLERSYARVVSAVEDTNQMVEDNIFQMLQSAYGRDRKISEEEQKAIAEPYRKKHGADLVDPNKVKSVIETLREQIDTFTSEVDYVLSEANARTTINVSDV